MITSPLNTSRVARRVLSILFLLAFFVFPAGASLSDYYSLKDKNPAQARLALEKTVKADPSNVNARLEMAYLLLGEGKTDEAIPHLEAAREADPNNAQVNSQLGYALAQAGRQKEARALFSQEAPTCGRGGACQALNDLATRRFQFLPSPFFAEASVTPIYFSRFDNTVVYSQARAGAAFGARDQFEVYAGARVVDDSESRGGQLPIIFSDNAAVFALGVRLVPFARFPLSLYAETGQARDLLDRGRDRWREDHRAGASYFNRWTPLAHCGPGFRFPFKRSSSLYADIGVYSRYDRNWIGYLQWREGLRVLEMKRAQLDGFLYAGGVADSNDDFFNNVIELGGGGELIPDHSWPLRLRYTVVKGEYQDASGGEPNPYPKTYTDHRWEASVFLRF